MKGGVLGRCLPSVTVQGRCHALSHIFGNVNHDAPAALPGVALGPLPPWRVLEGFQCKLMVLLEERLLEQGLMLLPSSMRASFLLEVAEVGGSQRVQIPLVFGGTFIFRVILRRDGAQDGHRVWHGEVIGRLRQ